MWESDLPHQILGCIAGQAFQSPCGDIILRGVGVRNRRSHTDVKETSTPHIYHSQQLGHGINLCPRADEQTQKMGCLHPGQCCSATERATTWVNLENIALKKIIQAQKDQYGTISLTHGASKADLAKRSF